MPRFSFFLVLAANGSAGAVVTRDDTDDALYRFAASEFAPLVDLPTEGHGVLIAPQWVVTAAHAVAWQSRVDVVVFNGSPRDIQAVAATRPGLGVCANRQIVAAAIEPYSLHLEIFTWSTLSTT